MNTRDQQIAVVKERSSRLEVIPGRLKDCYAEVLRAYQESSLVSHLARVVEESDRTPSDFRVLTNSEARSIREFNDVSYHWDMFCRELGRSIALAEQRYLFQELENVLGQSQIDSSDPRFASLVDAIDDLVAAGYSPNVMCGPLELFVPFESTRGLRTVWDGEGAHLAVPGRPPLKIHWSNAAAPLRRFVIYASHAATWTAKVDPSTGGRLTVAIGEPESPANAVMFLAETVAKFEVTNPAAFRAVGVAGEPLDPEEYVNREMLR